VRYQLANKDRNSIFAEKRQKNGMTKSVDTVKCVNENCKNYLISATSPQIKFQRDIWRQISCPQLTDLVLPAE
jgi:hypothetical protein